MRFFRMARRSATECAAELTLCEEFGLVRHAELVDGRVLLHSIVSMLTVMTRKGGDDS
jgi:hypothetical protein